jgi:colicin import membrane protein
MAALGEEMNAMQAEIVAVAAKKAKAEAEAAAALAGKNKAAAEAAAASQAKRKAEQEAREAKADIGLANTSIAASVQRADVAGSQGEEQPRDLAEADLKKVMALRATAQSKLEQAEEETHRMWLLLTGATETERRWAEGNGAANAIVAASEMETKLVLDEIKGKQQDMERRAQNKAVATELARQLAVRTAAELTAQRKAEEAQAAVSAAKPRELKAKAAASAGAAAQQKALRKPTSSGQKQRRQTGP